MTSSLRGLLVVAAAAVMAMATPSKADVIVGQPADSGAGNCIPFGCTIAWTSEYQQIYAASQFSGPITITNLEFFNTQFRKYRRITEHRNVHDLFVDDVGSSQWPRSNPRQQHRAG